MNKKKSADDDSPTIGFRVHPSLYEWIKTQAVDGESPHQVVRRLVLEMAVSDGVSSRSYTKNSALVDMSLIEDRINERVNQLVAPVLKRIQEIEQQLGNKTSLDLPFVLPVKLVKNCTNHPTLQYDDPKSIVVIDSKPYIRCSDKIFKSIIPEEIQYTTIGEPYKELARFVFWFEDKWEDSIYIEPSDLPDLIELLSSFGSILSVPQELLKYLEAEDHQAKD